jgi:hypothetical protein
MGRLGKADDSGEEALSWGRAGLIFLFFAHVEAARGGHPGGAHG